MSKVRIYGDTSGYVDIAVPAVAGTRTLNLDKVPQTATNGNTGIGTDNPSQNLHVSSADHTRVLITGGTDKYAELQFENDAQKFAMGVQNDDKFFLYNSTGTSQVLTIDTSNNIGIGTQSPDQKMHLYTGAGTTLYKAEVNANSTVGLEIKKTGSTTQSWRIVDGQTVNGALQFYDVTDSRVAMQIDGTGNFLVAKTVSDGAIKGFEARATGQVMATVASATNEAVMYITQTGGGGNNGDDQGLVVKTQGTNAVSGTGNVLRIAANNSTHGTFDNILVAKNNGNVGIGTSSPNDYYAKDLVVNAADEGGITIVNGTTEQGYLMFADGTGGSPDARFRGYIGYDHNIDTMQMTSGGILKFLVNDTSPAMTILANGNVGIGTTNPDVKLDVGNSDSGSAGVVGIQIQNSQDFSTVYNGTNVATFAGIQTVNHDDTSNRTPTGLVFVHRSSSSGIAAIQSTSTAGDRADLRFITRGSGGISEKMIIDDEGKVGINTTNPLAQLEIDPSAVDTPIFAIRREDSTSIPLFKFFQDSSVAQGTGHAHMNTGNRDLSITADTNSTKTLGIYLKTTGQVGIGTDSPAYKLQVNGSVDILNLKGSTGNAFIRFTDSDATADFSIGSDDGSGAGAGAFILYDRSNSAYRLAVNSSGNVGIGTTSPGVNLEVNASGNTFILVKDRSSGSGLYFKAASSGAAEIQTAGGSNTMGFRTSGQERVHISSAGYVTKPYQPSFSAVYNGSSWSTTGGSTMIHNHTGGGGHNIGNHYSTSTGRFTAPVAGSYQFNWYSICVGTYSNAYIQFFKNGARMYGGDIHISKNESGWDTYNWTRTIYLSVGDYIEPKQQGTMTWHGNHWNNFGGYLVG